MALTPTQAGFDQQGVYSRKQNIELLLESEILPEDHTFKNQFSWELIDTTAADFLFPIDSENAAVLSLFPYSVEGNASYAIQGT